MAPTEAMSATDEPETPEKNHRGDDVDVTEAAGQPAHHGLGEIENALRNTPPLHDGADEDEQRHGDEQEGVHGREHRLRQQVHRHGGKEPERADAGERQRNGERYTEHAETEKGDEKKDRHGSMSC